MTTEARTEKKRIQVCPTCGGPLHKDPATGRFTRHPADLSPPPPAAPEPAPLPKRKRGLFGRKRT